MHNGLFVAIGILVVAMTLVARHFYIHSAEAQGVESEFLVTSWDEFDYDRLITLDAESLFEQGMLNGYKSVVPELQKYTEPARMVEIFPEGTDDYLIEIDNKQYNLFDDDVAQKSVTEGWALATYTFFHVVNLQLVESEYKFFAWYGANDLSGAFMTQSEVIAYRKAHAETPRYWPYLPTLNKPDYGYPGDNDDFWHGLGHSGTPEQ